MGTRYFEGEARRSFWSVHVEAWRRSKVSKRKYCGEHRLSVASFGRWLEHFLSKEAVELRAELLREERKKKRIRRHIPLRRNWKNKAAQAFWAMHVEALIWSGMSTRSYAKNHNLSPDSLRKWRNRIEEEELEIDWRGHLHPSARPVLSSGLSSAAKVTEVKKDLTEEPAVELKPDGRSNRRRFTDEEKRAIAQESVETNVSAAELCRQHGIVTSMLFRWRVQFGFGGEGRAKLAAVSMKNDRSIFSNQPLVLHDLIPVPDGMMTVELGDGRRVFAPEGSDVEEVRRRATPMGET
ncbi:MAG: transposase [Fimbriimonadaceae bacterium]|nr:transposase [Alphaproteobacteria bacterium]